MVITRPLGIDRTVTLTINGSTQRVRMCGDRAGLPPLLVVQAGPGLPVLHEVAKFQRHLNLEKHFLVNYWEQRGCGVASREDAARVSLRRQVDDLRAVLRWLHKETHQTSVLFGISVGGTIALRAAADHLDHARAVIAISPDVKTTMSDACVYTFLEDQCSRSGSRRLRRRVTKLGTPPYVDTAALRRRASLLMDLGTIEQGATFSTLLRQMLFSLVRTYGVLGAARALRNLDLVQRTLMPELVSLDLIAKPPHVAIPVHYVFGERDALTPASFVTQLPKAIAAPGSTVTYLRDAGHMAHFDQPEVVRSIAIKAIGAAYPSRVSARAM